MPKIQATVSQGLNRDSLKLLRHSQFSGFQPSLPTPDSIGFTEITTREACL